MLRCLRRTANRHQTLHLSQARGVAIRFEASLRYHSPLVPVLQLAFRLLTARVPPLPPPSLSAAFRAWHRHHLATIREKAPSRSSRATLP